MQDLTPSAVARNLTARLTGNVTLLGKSAALDGVRARNLAARLAGDALAQLYAKKLAGAVGVDFVRLQAGLDAAVEAFVKAEVDVDLTLIEAWASIEIRPTQPRIDSSLALRLAALETEVWLRRSFAPTSHTRVKGLEKSDACRGGILEDGLIERHGIAQTRGFLGSAREESDALRRFATQIACMGAYDVRKLDASLEGVTNGVEYRLGKAGLGALIPSYQRMMAPIILLVLDATKQHGEFSRSYQWFEKRKTALRTTVSTLGWSASRTVFLYDRRRGDLVGFPQCMNASAPGCIDPMVLLDSLTPRALGLGTCGLDAMIVKGTQPSAGGAMRYTCPSVECGVNPTPPPSSGGSGPGGLAGTPMLNASQSGASRWRSMWPSQGLVPDSTLNGVLCISGTAATKSLLGSANESCIDEIFANAPKSPFDAYVTCVAAGVAGPGENGSIDELGGIPSSPQCDLSEEPATPDTKSDADKEKEKKAAEEKAKLQAEEEKKLQDKIKEAVEKLKKELAERVEKIALKKAKDAAKKFVEEKAAEIAAAVGRSIFISIGPALAVIPGGILGGGQWMVETERQRQELEAIDRGDTQEALRLAGFKGQPPGDVAPQLRKNRSCTDPMRCSNQCSSLGAQVTKATACSQGFVNEVMRRSGMAPRSVPPARDLGRVSKPRPDAVPAGGDATGVCVGGAAVVRTGMSACGAVLCTGTIAAGTASACCGGAVSNTALNRAAECYGMNCGDAPVVVNPVTGRCGCEQAAPIGPPPESPLGPPGPPN